MHWGRFAIERCGSSSCMLNVMEKIGEDNRKVEKINGNPFTKPSRWT
jgi:hypothetical protein